MLFLHALLFSLLATSTLAIPVSGADSPIETPKEAIGSDRFNGLWSLATPAINKSPSTKPSSTKLAPHHYVIEITGDETKSVKVLSKELPQDEDPPKGAITTEDFFSEYVPELSHWLRSTKPEEYKTEMRKAAPEETKFQVKETPDILRIRHSKEQKLYITLIPRNGGEKIRDIVSLNTPQSTKEEPAVRPHPEVPLEPITRSKTW